MSKIDASVIIPTYNRKEALLETLESLSCQNWPAQNYEVIVVDDGSTEEIKDVAVETFPFTLRYIRQSNQGSAFARNTGASMAQGSLLIFVDDDIWAEPDYIGGLIDEHNNFSKLIGMGKFLPYLPENASPFARTYAHLMATDGVGSKGKFVDFTACVTNNLSVRRLDFFEVGMMEEVAGDGPTWWGDIDFGYRAYKLGYCFRRSGKAACIHRDYSIQSLKIASERAYKISYMAVSLFRKYPELVRLIPMFSDKLPMQWDQDSLALIIRKIIRPLASSEPVIWSMERFVKFIERFYPSSHLLVPLYRWILGSHIFRGFRAGLSESNQSFETITQ